MFQVLSDIHLEKTPKKYAQKRILSLLPEHRTPYLFLAGDIGNPHEQSYWDFLTLMSSSYSFVFLITGNKEYDLEKDLENEVMKVDLFIHREIVRLELKNVFFLNNKSIEMNDFIIVGTTLWSRIKKCTFPNDRIITKLFEKNVEFVEKQVWRYRSSSKPLILLTHFAPTKCGTTSVGVVQDDFHSSELFSILPDHCRVGISACVYGHTHFNPRNHKNFVTGLPMFVCNQSGYGYQMNGKNRPIFQFSLNFSFRLGKRTRKYSNPNKNFSSSHVSS